jgi:outer membrane protein insertion porin family
VTTAEDFVVDNNYGRFEASADVRVVGTASAPGLTGRIALGEAGRIYLAGRTFRITRGDIFFTDLRRIRPEFNIAASAQVGTDTITVTIAGTPERPSVDLASAEGSKTPGEVALELVGGATPESALSLLAGDLLGITGRAIGLDTLRVERGAVMESEFREDPSLLTNDPDPSTRLTVAKRLSDQVEVTLSQNLRASGKATVVVRYSPVPPLEVRGLSRDNATLGLGVRHRVTFGGGAAAAGAGVMRAERPTVAEVRFADTPPAVEAEARRRISIRPGRPLEFLNLQRDLDEIRSDLHAKGHFEARVRARRIERDDTRRVTVEFAVQPGPTTRLEVRGVTIPPAEQRALEDAWSRNLLDQFLIDDLTHRVRRYLVTTGTIASVVVGTIERPSPDEKRVRIDVTPGVPIDGREVRFSGNEHIAPDVLRAELARRGLDLDVWIDPPAAGDAVASVYRQAGYLRVQVSSGPLDVDGSVGVLPVRVVEGPRAEIRTVRFDGVAAERQAAAEAAANVAPPAPYVAAAVDDARRRLEDWYRTGGFTRVSVDAETAIGERDTVSLTFRVSEGPQQVLREIVTEGEHRTSDGVIRDAVQLSIGKPVNPDEWARARKRLYDTNVFRQVEIDAVPVGDIAGGVQPVRARVRVREQPRWSVRYGFQLEAERSPSVGELARTENAGFVAEVKNQNLFGRAHTAGGFAQYRHDTEEANLFFSTPRLFGYRARSLVYAFLTRERLRDEQQAVAAIADRTGASAEQRWRAWGMEFLYGYRYERNHTFDPEPAPTDPFPLDFTAKLGHLSAAAVRDRRDDVLDPRRGTFSSTSWEQAASWLGSDITNRRLLLQQYLFAPVGPRVVLASRAQLGLVFGPDELLPRDRFRAGGATTVRGYAEESLGPRDVFGLPAGGQTFVVLNQEARISLHKWVGAVGFVDAGGVTAKEEAFTRNALKVGYGFGLRANTPVGLVRVDFGVPVSRLGPTDAVGFKNLRWYVGIGHIF